MRYIKENKTQNHGEPNRIHGRRMKPQSFKPVKRKFGAISINIIQNERGRQIPPTKRGVKHTKVSKLVCTRVTFFINVRF